MFHTTLSSLAAMAMLLLSTIVLPGAQAQQPQARSIELNQTLIDQWLLAMPAAVTLGKSASAPQTDDAARPHVEKICSDAGFRSYDQCAEVMGYVGMIISACDRRAQAFRDPIPLMRRHLARLERDTTMPQAARDQAIADVKEILAAFPNGFPAEHIQLMNANRDRIFATLATLPK